MVFSHLIFYRYVVYENVRGFEASTLSLSYQKSMHIHSICGTSKSLYAQLKLSRYRFTHFTNDIM